MNYKDRIKRRDYGTCCICGSRKSLHVHHISSRRYKGCNDWFNLITLCNKCHKDKAHGSENAQYREFFRKYTSQFERPKDWDDVMKEADKEHEEIKKMRRDSAKKAYKWKTQLKQILNEEAKEKIGITNDQLIYRASVLSKQQKISLEDAKKLIISQLSRSHSSAQL